MFSDVSADRRAEEVAGCAAPEGHHSPAPEGLLFFPNQPHSQVTLRTTCPKVTLCKEEQEEAAVTAVMSHATCTNRHTDAVTAVMPQSHATY